VSNGAAPSGAAALGPAGADCAPNGWGAASAPGAPSVGAGAGPATVGPASVVGAPVRSTPALTTPAVAMASTATAIAPVCSRRVRCWARRDPASTSE